MKIGTFAICSTAFLVLSAKAAMADTMWTLNNVVTQSGGTITGFFDVLYNSNPLLDTLGGYALTYTPTSGSAISFDAASGNSNGFYYPGYGNGTGCNAVCPPPNSTAFLDVATLFTGGPISSMALLFDVSALPDLGPTSASVSENLCTTANAGNSNSVCWANYDTTSFVADANQAPLVDFVDPGTANGTYILGTPGPGSGITTMPEPSALLMLSTVLVGVGALVRKRRLSGTL